MLNPLLLWFLPLAAVPIVLHLVTLYRLRTVELSTYRFLMDSYTQQRRRVRLLEWLVLLLRAAFIALIVMVMARPVIEPLGFLGQSSTGRDVSVIVDTGPSTGLRTAGTSALDRERSAARTVIDQLGSDDRLHLIAAGAQPRMLAQGFAGDENLAASELQALEPGARSASFGKAIDRALAGDAQGARYVYLVTDGRRGPWQQLAGHRALKKLDDQTQVVVLDVGTDKAPANRAVLGHGPRNHTPLRGLPLLLRTTVARSGQSPSQTSTDRIAQANHSAASQSPDQHQGGRTTLSVILGDRTVKRLSLGLSSSPGQSTLTRSLTVTPQQLGTIRGRFEVPADQYPADNQFRFTLHVRPQLNVTILTGPASNHADDNPRQDPALYLRSALASPSQTTASQSLTQQDRKLAKSISLSTQPAKKFDDQTMKRSDVLVLADVPMDEKLAKQLGQFTSTGAGGSGGGLLVMPGPHIKASNYRKQLFTRLWQSPNANDDAQSGEDLPLRFGKPVGDVEDESAFQPIGEYRSDHPVLSAFKKSEDGEKYFETARIYRHFPLLLRGETDEADEPKKDSENQEQDAQAQQGIPVRVLMRLSDGSPLLAQVHSQVGAFSPSGGPTASTQGGSVNRQADHGARLLVTGFSATPAWSNLPLKPEFVPLMLRAVAYLRPGPAVRVPSVVRAGEPAPIRITDRWPDASVQALSPGGRRQSIELHRSGRQLVGALMQTDKSGYYRFEVVPNQPTAPDRIERDFSVNVQASADALMPASPRHVKEMLSPAKVSYVSSSPDDPVLAAQLTEKSEVWRTLIWITFLVIGAEFLIATLRPGGERGPGKLLTTTTRWTSDLYRTLLPGTRGG